jgi:hypothetical protein
MKAKGWLGDRGRSRIVLERGKEGITLDGKAGMMRCEKSDGLIVAMMSVPVNGG